MLFAYCSVQRSDIKLLCWDLSLLCNFFRILLRYTADVEHEEWDDEQVE
jgi:hypothetical protein